MWWRVFSLCAVQPSPWKYCLHEVGSHIFTYHRHLFILPRKVWLPESRNCLFFFTQSIHTQCFRHLKILPFTEYFLISTFAHNDPSTGMSSSPHSLSTLSKLYAAFRVQLKHYHHETFPNLNWKKFLSLILIPSYYFLYALQYLPHSINSHRGLIYICSFLSYHLCAPWEDQTILKRGILDRIALRGHIWFSLVCILSACHSVRCIVDAQ